MICIGKKHTEGTYNHVAYTSTMFVFEKSIILEYSDQYTRLIINFSSHDSFFCFLTQLSQRFLILIAPKTEKIKS